MLIDICTVSKLIEYHGKVAHAAQAPREGINALNAALIGVMGLTPFVKLSMNVLLRENSNPISGKANVYQGPHITSSTDIGDVSHLMPVIHPWGGCINGVLYSVEYEISVPDIAYIKRAQALAMLIIDLLYYDVAGSKDVLDNFTPALNK